VQQLAQFNIATYVPTQKVKRRWSDRVKVIDRVVIPGYIFVHCSFADRLRMLEAVRSVYGYITDGPHQPAIVPDSELEAFARMVSDSGTEVIRYPDDLAKGDKVKVVSGPLEGLECELVNVMEKSCLAVRLHSVGTMLVEISLDCVRKF